MWNGPPDKGENISLFVEATVFSADVDVEVL